MKQRTILITATTLFAITGVFLLMGDSGLPLPSERIEGSAAIVAASSIVTTSMVEPPSIKSDASRVGLPIRIKIPSIHVDAPIQNVGIDAAGQMQAPSNGTNVAWYQDGTKPGQSGNAVFAGHLDTFTSRYGVFMSLAKISNGADVYVTDEQQKTYHFRVVRKVAYGYRDAPIDEIFGASATPHLNLITCSGVWDSRAHSYTQRTVVYTELVL